MRQIFLKWQYPVHWANVSKNKNDYSWISSGHMIQFGDSQDIAFLSS